MQTRDVRCFKIPELPLDSRYRLWMHELHGISLSDTLKEHLSRIIPLLLCGEQSAVLAFERESAAQHKSVFHEIAIEENSHEAALQLLFKFLPAPDNLEETTQRAKEFFLRLGDAPSKPLYFARVAELDLFTCKIMSQVPGSKITKDGMLYSLAEMIKRDEAGHVSACKRHARELGVKPEDAEAQKELMRGELIKLLEPVGDSFEGIGVDTDSILKVKKRLKS